MNPKLKISKRQVHTVRWYLIPHQLRQNKYDRGAIDQRNTMQTKINMFKSYVIPFGRRGWS